MRRGPRPQIITNLPPVNLTDLPVTVMDRDDQGTGEMLMPTRAQNPQPLQAAAQVLARDGARMREAVTQGPVRIPELERLHRFGVGQLAALEERPRIPRLPNVRQGGLVIDPTT